MNILIVGSGAREHAIGYKLSQSPHVDKIFAAPGNGGLAAMATCVDIAPTDLEGLLAFAQAEQIDLTVVGGEDPLCLGIVDLFEANGLRAFGPHKAAAQLEGSKAFAKEFMVRNGIHTANYIKTEDIEEAKTAYRRMLLASPYGKAVIKADGLSAGKGVLVGETLRQGLDFIDDINNHKFGPGDFAVVVEEYLEGIETSLLCFVDHNTIVGMPTVKDHKRIGEGERGSNTGGMGTYSPNPIAEAYAQEIWEKTAVPFHKALQREDLLYRGIIFFGLMITQAGVRVLEFNTRFGDPETQSILMRLESDLYEIFDLALKDQLTSMGELQWSDQSALTLVLASKGYPEAYGKGYEITGLDNAKGLQDMMIFHAGTKLDQGKVVTAGGRVLSITALGSNTDEAMKKAYAMADKIDFQGKTYRKDIGPMVKRIYVSKKPQFDLEAMALRGEIRQALPIELEGIRLYQRYDIQGMTLDQLEAIKDTIFSEPPVDDVFIQEEAFAQESLMENPLVVELHRGQYDQREDGLRQSISVALGIDEVMIRCAKVFDLRGSIEKEDLQKIASFIINPVDQQEGVMKLPNLLEEEQDSHSEATELEGFIDLDEHGLNEFFHQNSLAMKLADLKFFQNYFKNEEKRNPTDVELALIDTYWSDHCRHTTFNTILTDLAITSGGNALIDKLVLEAYKSYLDMREDSHGSSKPMTLMDLGTIMARYMRKKGLLADLEVSEEINAASIKIQVEIDGQLEDYLLMFKNETHNHPTEVEPFGGASTCLGGAIRDPLSGRSYVYQAMRFTGSGDPREALEDTLPGKLPQKKITREAARGYSSYGNQIGLCTGYVDEVYHQGFKAKRMEVGAVIGAAPAANVVRKSPFAGDVILLIGGRTGRDGVGGATGSSKEHTQSSITQSSAEVQKGNAPSERKLLRLFRNPEAAKLIKKCNDFGAGGVSVAIGELADGLDINLDRVPLKYKGLTPREIAISESQERMAVVLAPEDVEHFEALCHMENIETARVALVTADARLKMTYRDKVVVDMSREFVDSAGVTGKQEVTLAIPTEVPFLDMTTGQISDIEEALKTRIADLNVCSKKGLIERFDNTIGAGSVLVPLGGRTQLTPAQGMAALIPVEKGQARTASYMAVGYNPQLSEESPFHGAYYAVIESVSRLAAMGAPVDRARLSFQEYFEKLGEDPVKWGKPFLALLGALKAQEQLGIPAIGGKDSMSGTFHDLTVPPTLISFAVSYGTAEGTHSPELKGIGSTLGLLTTPYLPDGTLDMGMFHENLNTLRKLRASGKLLSVSTVTREGVLATLAKMAFGNFIGMELVDLDYDMLMKPLYGSFVVEMSSEDSAVVTLGQTIKEQVIKIGGLKEITLESLLATYEEPLEEVFPVKNKKYILEEPRPYPVLGHKLNPGTVYTASSKIARPQVTISVFPGSNCEYDSASAFENAGAKAQIHVMRNLTLSDVDQSILELEQQIRQSQIYMIPGGFSLGDEPDGSGKFIAAVLRNPRIQDALQELLQKNDGLILGICNGFQALIKAGLLPYGEILTLDQASPTLTHNEAGRHVAQFVKTKVNSLSSPWTQSLELGAIHDIPVSHGEGRFIAEDALIKKLYDSNQVAFTYVDPKGQPAVDRPYNPNGSMGSIEGLLSPDGRILGKMGHSERIREGLYKNYPVAERQLIFESGVNYFK